MAGWNGSGTFTRTYNWTDDKTNGIKITSARHDQNDIDFVNGINNSLTKDGQNSPTANLPMATYRHTGVGEAAARTDYARFSQVQDGKANWVDGGGSADAITATYAIPVTDLVDGQQFFVRATAANATTTPTFNPSGLGALTITKNGGSALVAGDIAGDGYEMHLRYRLDDTEYELLNPATPSLTAPFADSTAIVKGSSDASKLARFEVDGLTTATTRVMTVPDKDITIAGTDDIKVPTYQYLTSGTAATYTTPTGARKLRIWMRGGDGGGGGTGSSGATDGGNGGNSIFNSIEADGGDGGLASNGAGGGAGGAGGSSGTGTADLRIDGTDGCRGLVVNASYAPVAEGQGGINILGGKGGKGGVSNGATIGNGGGGGGGEVLLLEIDSPSASYTYTVGAAGTAGGAGTLGNAGEAGRAGLIIVEEYY